MSKRRPVILSGNPYILGHQATSAEDLFGLSGGNTGNLAFRYGVATSLVSPVFLPLGAPPELIRKSGDIVVLPLANQLGRHVSLGDHAERLRAIDLPVLGLGLGAQANSFDQNIELDAGTNAWLREIATRAPSDHPNIGARGPYSRDQIARLGWENSAIVTGCPSNFISTLPNLAAQLADGFRKIPKRIAVAAGIPFIPALFDIERHLADIVTLTDGAYIVQHGLEMIQLSRSEFDNILKDKFELCRNYILPRATAEEFKSWCAKFSWVFNDVRVWMDFVRRFDFVVGTRFHGAMLAIQAGIPAACIAHDSRTLEMCQTMAIPVCHYKDINCPLTRHNIMDYFNYDEAAFIETRQRLRKDYVNILQAADLEVAPSILKAA